MKNMTCWAIGGFLFTSILGTLLHFAFEWSGGDTFVALFSAVNESIWEHMKLLFFPMLLFSLMEYTKIGKDFPNFWCVKVLGTSVGLAAIPALYYTYTGSLGVSADWFNIAIFFIAAGLAYWLETKLLQAGGLRCRFPAAALGMLLIFGIVFVMLTFYPPNLPLFQPEGSIPGRIAAGNGT